MSDPDTRGWGRYPDLPSREIIPLWHREDGLPPPADWPHLARGNGRSYGDQCQNEGGRLLATRGLDRFIDFDARSGLLTCEAGVTLREILALSVPRGWMPPVMPGTSEVTVGGAIANDVHGKNHHSAGCFGQHVEALTLLRSDGRVLECRRDQNHEMFAATIAGMGLTGVISQATLRLRPVASDRMRVRSIRFANLDEFFALSEQNSDRHEYSVSWIDCLASGSRLGRGHFIVADHDDSGFHGPARSSALSMPLTPPISLVNGLSLRLFNSLYYWRQPSRERSQVSHYGSYFFPLDGIAHWNRMYGPRGFIQYQCVIPEGGDMQAQVAELLNRISRSGLGSFLAVLKTFGRQASPGMLSFPMPGTTLALDFPRTTSDRLTPLCRALDEVVLQAGGRIYMAKDAMTQDIALVAPADRLQEFRRYIDPGCSSSLARRLGIAE